jgi:undecaprenyl pyrophosphate phosphatase UppP
VKSESPTGHRVPVGGTAALIVAVAVMVGMAILFRFLFLIILGIGVIVAVILYFWHRLRPLKEEDIENKRPLGL